MEPSPSPDPEESTGPPCAPFDDLEHALILLNIPQGTSELRLYFKLTGGGLEFWDAAGEAAYWASLGTTEAEGYQEEGFPDRIYFLFSLPASVPGTGQDFQLFKEGCGDPLVSIPRVSIPEVFIPDADQPDSPTCKSGLEKNPCEKAGGTYNTHGGVSQPTCDCP
jgi:hypothetical protein